MLFVDHSSELFDAFKSKYHETAEQYKGKGISFLLGHIEASQGAFQVSYFPVIQFCLCTSYHMCLPDILAKHSIYLNEQYFGLKDDQVPLIVIQTNDGQKYLKANLEPDHIASWVKEYQVIHLLL